MGRSPAFQMYAADIYMDTNEWPVDAFGIYNRLLYHQWVNGSIPQDIKTLAQISFVSVKKMSKSWPIMASKFVFDESHRGVNIRLEATRQEQVQFSKTQREKANARWGKRDAAACAAGYAPADAEALPGECSSSSSSSSIDIPIVSVYTDTSGDGENHRAEKATCPHQVIIEIYHEILPMLPTVKKWPEHLQAILRTRWTEEPERSDLLWWRKFFRYVKESDFLTGKVNEFRADLEWLIRPKNFTKIANGRYHRGLYGRGNWQPGIDEWVKYMEEKDAKG